MTPAPDAALLVEAGGVEAGADVVVGGCTGGVEAVPPPLLEQAPTVHGMATSSAPNFCAGLMDTASPSFSGRRTLSIPRVPRDSASPSC
jgi:hypothetical protein